MLLCPSWVVSFHSKQRSAKCKKKESITGLVAAQPVVSSCSGRPHEERVVFYLMRIGYSSMYVVEEYARIVRSSLGARAGVCVRNVRARAIFHPRNILQSSITLSTVNPSRLHQRGRGGVVFGSKDPPGYLTGRGGIFFANKIITPGENPGEKNSLLSVFAHRPYIYYIHTPRDL